MRIELSIDQLVADGLGLGSAEELVAALTAELRAGLARELGPRPPTASQAISVPRLRAALTLPATSAGAGAAATGRAIGAALAGAVTGGQAFPSARRPR